MMNDVRHLATAISGGIDALSISWKTLENTLWLLVVLAVSFAVLFTIYTVIKKISLKRAQTKKQTSKIIMFLRIVKYVFATIIILLFVSLYFDSLAELGLIAGLLTVALGFALRQPLTNFVAWIIIVIRRPFFIGDRIIVGNTKGDVSDISLTYMELKEIRGTIDGEERSGRIVVIPNLTLFEKEIINYTAQHQYIVDEVVTAVTYESDLQEAENIALQAVEEVMQPWWEYFPQQIAREPHIRLHFRPSGIDITVRYYVLAKKRNEIATNITRVIFNRIRSSASVEIAYPHTEIIFREKYGKKQP
ncbi:MAG: mechanosensitive ion channel [Candidatus Thermoplasmatota archaeon]|nr:mechanosensitive ion channel [Candidatus Thermoplasmatota archaeon]